MRPLILLAALAALATTQANAQTVEADNGTTYRITSVAPTIGGGVDAVVYQDGAPGDQPSALEFWFDCAGHMTVYSYATQARSGPSIYVAPRSVAGRIAQIACKSAGPRHPNMTSDCGNAPGVRACTAADAAAIENFSRGR